MSSENRPLIIIIKRSRQLLMSLLALHLIAFTLIGAQSMPWWLRCLLLGAVMLSFIYDYRRQTNRSLVKIYLTHQHKWLLHHPNMPAKPVTLDEFFVSHGLILLTFSDGGILPYSVILLSDSSDTETLRRLRVYLKFSAIPAN